LTKSHPSSLLALIDPCLPSHHPDDPKVRRQSSCPWHRLNCCFLQQDLHLQDSESPVETPQPLCDAQWETLTVRFYLECTEFCLTCTLDFTFAAYNQRICVNYWREQLRQSWRPVTTILFNTPPSCLDSLLLRTGPVPFLRHTHPATKISASTRTKGDYCTACLLHPANKKSRIVILRDTRM